MRFIQNKMRNPISSIPAIRGKIAYFIVAKGAMAPAFFSISFFS